MRPKSGLPKRKALRNTPKFAFGFRDNPATAQYRNPLVGPSEKTLEGPVIRTVSLFSGCGGFDFGLLGGFRYLGEYYEPQPFEMVGAYDIDEKAIETYRLNIGGDHAQALDLVQADPKALPAADLLLGGFPCQDFSTCGPKEGLDGKRGRLYRIMADYMSVHRPKVVVAENVPGLARLHGGLIMQTVLDELSATGYRFKVWSLTCPDFGLPQSRRRIFLVGVRDDLPGHPMEPAPSHFMAHRAIEDGIDDLKTIVDESVPNQSQYFVATAATAGGGQGDHKSRRGALAYTVRANAKARIHFHYDLSRRLTVRECARLQSFPDEFVFPHFAMSNMVQIGNAVPPIVGHHVGRSLLEYFRR
ncbi:MAG: DNA cytosine methyltransferase, partial [Gemmatimonadaceae bacterium]